MERIIGLELGKLNTNLPKIRITLKEALASPKPRVQTRNGNFHFFKRNELDYLSGLLHELEWGELRLPIFLTFEPKLGRGTLTVNGSAEVKVISKIIQKKPTFDKLLIYRPELAILRKKLPTTTQYLFAG